jgi:SAM-dependent methyltransferase
MVHALREAYRVLKPGGLLIDLRPAPAHRRVGIVSGGRYRRLGITRESLDLDRAAERALRRVRRAGLFRLETDIRFDCRRVMDTPADFRAWVSEQVARRGAPPHDWLIRRVERVFGRARTGRSLVMQGPVVVRALRRLEARSTS